MHEWALAESILTAATDAAKKEKLKKITEIKIIIGELQQIEQDIFEFALDSIIKEPVNTMATAGPRIVKIGNRALRI